MQPPRQRGGGPDGGVPSFDEKLENEVALLDSLLGAMARDRLGHDAWERLHAAAQRDDRLSELAFAFESVSQSKRLKALPPATAAEFLYQAARFFGDVFGDQYGASTYLERALAVVPAHPPSFEKLEALLHKTADWKRLADLVASVAQHRPRAEQPTLLRRAAELYEKAGGADDKVIELYQQLLRLEPSDEGARAQLEARYVKANRQRDVVRLLEQALAVDPPPERAAARKLHSRILDLYANQLHEPERSIAHVEALLEIDPSHDEARKVAAKLVTIKGLAGRAAAALARACEAIGTPTEVAKYLAIELESTRGPKRRDVLHKIGVLKQERMNDAAGAFEALEQGLVLDASDDDMRARYVALAGKLKKDLDAAKTLNRVQGTVKDPAVKAHVAAQMGELTLRGGDAKRAKQMLVAVLAMQGAGPEAIHAAASALRGIYAKEGNKKALADVLDKIAQLETNKERAQEVDEELAALAMELKDTARAVAAYKRLLATPSRARALAALEPLYAASDDPASHAHLLEERGKDAASPAEARDLMFRAAEVRTTKTSDAVEAIAAWKRFIERFGPSRDAIKLYAPLVEAERQWVDFAQALDDDAKLAPAGERAEILACLGNVRMQKVRDVSGAIEAYGRALAVDANEKTARSTLEKLAASGDHRLPAADVLEPLYRAENAHAPLLKILELRASYAEPVDRRLAALDEAVKLAGASAQDHARALDLAGRGLAEAANAGLSLAAWLAYIDQHAGPGTDPKKRAGILGRALGDREVASADLAMLARRAGEAYAASGEIDAALSAYRRALAFEPQSTELLSRIDDLLRDQGSPGERVALYRAALERGADAARRKELLHRIGAIERHDLGDAKAAIATYRQALADDADDADAHAALVELYSRESAWKEVGTLLEARLERVKDEEARRTRAQLAEVAAAAGDTKRARRHCAVLLADEALGPDELAIVERVASMLEDFELAREVLRRWADLAQQPHEQIARLEELGTLEAEKRGDLEAAADTWKKAAGIAESSGDEAHARNLYRRVRKIAPEDREATRRLAELCERAEEWKLLPKLYAALIDQAADDAERSELYARIARVFSERLGDAEGGAREAARAFELAPASREVLATFERLCAVAHATELFDRTVQDVVGRTALDDAQRAELLVARARALASDTQRTDEAAHAYRALLRDRRLGEVYRAAVLAAFDALVASDESSAARRADRRWLLEWRADNARDDERLAALLAWAGAEENMFDDAARALELQKRVLAIDPDHADALAAVARLALAIGDTDGALAALVARRDRSEGPARQALELEIAQVLLARTTRFEEALASVRASARRVPAGCDGARAGREAARAPGDARTHGEDARGSVRRRRRSGSARTDPHAPARCAVAGRGRGRRAPGLVPADARPSSRARGDRARARNRRARRAGAAPHRRTLGSRRGTRARAAPPRRSRGPLSGGARPRARQGRSSRARSAGRRVLRGVVRGCGARRRHPRARPRDRSDGAMGVRSAQAPVRCGRALGRLVRAVRSRDRVGRRREARRAARGSCASREGLRRSPRPRHRLPRAPAREQAERRAALERARASVRAPIASSRARSVAYDAPGVAPARRAAAHAGAHRRALHRRAARSRLGARSRGGDAPRGRRRRVERQTDDRRLVASRTHPRAVAGRRARAAVASASLRCAEGQEEQACRVASTCVGASGR
jgi:tetratricopeptide (TPR) repeat protein